MNIAHLLPYSAAFPLKVHNGRYDWALRLAQEQARRGHQVSMYAAPGSSVEGSKLVFASHEVAAFDDRTTNNIANISRAFSNEAHDIFHSHFDFLHYFMADSTAKPIVATQHWFPEKAFADAAQFARGGTVVTVPVTQAMAAMDQRLGMPYGEVIYHGIDLEQFRLASGSVPRGDRFLYVGRISPQKGVKQLVQLARQANLKLDIIGKVNSQDQPYWREIEALIDNDAIRYLGPKPQAELPAYYAQARALLFTPQRAEAFGQTIVEAQACGTPVITYDLGAAAELVAHGVSGFVVRDESGVADAASKVDVIDPGACRAQAEKFDIQTMYRQYEQLYEGLRRN